MEQWKDILGYEGRYQISDCGRVRSLGRRICSGYKNKSCRDQEERLMKQQLLIGSRNTTYLAVWLKKPGAKNKKMFVHRLVAQAFVFNPDSETLVIANHMDGDKFNNRASNLEWVDQTGNARHYRRGAARVEEREAAF